MKPTQIPVARELFEQWEKARGKLKEPAVRPFSRKWEVLLEDAGIISALDRRDAEHDIRALAEEDWLEIKPVLRKSYLIDRIVIPFAAEQRWCEVFGFVTPSDEETRAILAFDWEKRLTFLRASPVKISLSDLCQIDRFLKQGSRDAPLVPIKERSLQVFGDEKRLDSLEGGSLFGSDRLDLPRDLRCEIVGEPLPWKRGPVDAARQPILILENAATWHSYCRWNAEQKLFSAVIYGCGNRFVEGVRFLEEIFTEVGGRRPLFYFGDLDRQGLWIPQAASKRAESAGLPAIQPHLWSYRHLLTFANGQAQPDEESSEEQERDEVPSSEGCSWLRELAEPARLLLASGQRLPQEHLGWEFLRDRNRPIFSHEAL